MAQPTFFYDLGSPFAWRALVVGDTVPGWASTALPIYFIGGVQLLCLGIVGEYIGKILSELKARPIYFVAEHSVKRVDPATSEDVGERTAAE